MSGCNLPSVTVDIFTKIIEMQFNENNFRPIFGLGKGGIGKTESIFELAKKLNVGYIDIRLLLYSETDLKGIPYPNKDNTRTIWLQNNILPVAERDGNKGILVFDEITSCARSVRTAAYQLLNERRLGDYVLPDGWLVVCLGNGEDDGGDYQGMEGNFVNRCSVFEVVPNIDAWKIWGAKHGLNELVSAYVSFRPNDLHSYEPDNETEMLFASPRSWTAVSNILNTYGYRENDDVLNVRIIANLGQRVGQQFIAFCKFKNFAVDPMSIVKNGELPKINQQEILMITLQSVVKIVGEAIDTDMDNLNGAVQEITLKYLANTLNWIISLDRKEYSTMGIKDIMNYGNGVIRKLSISPELIQLCPNFIKFAHENKAIFS